MSSTKQVFPSGESFYEIFADFFSSLDSHDWTILFAFFGVYAGIFGFTRLIIILISGGVDAEEEKPKKKKK